MSVVTVLPSYWYENPKSKWTTFQRYRPNWVVIGLFRPYLTFRLLTTVCDSWRPPFLSHGLPGARCISTNVMTITKKTTGIIHRMRRTTKIASAPPRVPENAVNHGGGRAPRVGRPAITAIQSLVLKDIRVLVLLVAGKVLVVEGSVDDVHVRLPEVVLVLLEDETNRSLVDQDLLRRRVVGVALRLVDLGVRLLDDVVVSRQGRASKVQTVAGAAGEDVSPVLLVGVVRAPSVRAVDVELAFADVAGHGLAVDHVERHVQTEVGVPLVDDERVQRLVAGGVAGHQLQLVQGGGGDAGLLEQSLGRGRVEALSLV